LKSLTATERNFLGTIQKIAFSNPYGEECRQACLDFSNNKIAAPPDLLESASRQVDQLLGRLKNENNMDLAQYSEEDRWLLHHGVLFLCLNRFKSGFEKLITEQFRQGSLNVPVPFAADALGMMTRAGM